MAYKILIVEDEHDIGTYLATVLRANGFDPTVAGDAESGLQIARRVRPDLICLDIMMPKESGISMYSRLRQDRELKDTPVIIISGAGQNGTFDFRSYVTDETIPEPDHYLEKPVSAERYIAVVNEILSTTPSSLGKNDNA